MLLSHSSNMPANKDSGMADGADEPPDEHFLHGSSISVDEGLVYVKSPTAANQKESLLTRALKTSPDLIPSDRRPSHDNTFYHPYPYHNVSGISTAELTSDGGLTSPSLSNTSSPPLPSTLAKKQPLNNDKASGPDASEFAVEANLGRKRCISFACGRKLEQPKQQQEPQQDKQPATEGTNPEPTPTEPVKRKSALTFVCPGRNSETKRDRCLSATSGPRARLRGSPAPISRQPATESEATQPASVAKDQKAGEQNESRGVPTSGLGQFEDSEATRFHEFASSVDEDDEWVKKAVDYAGKITMSDCMKKEIAIRKLGEEAEEEALDEEAEEENDMVEEDENDEEEDDDDEDAADDGSTIHDFSDDGNESDNEAGFASDDSDASDNEFWAPLTTTTAASPQTIYTKRVDRRNSNTSYESGNDGRQRWIPVPVRNRTTLKAQKIRPDTPDLPDSTDFVCGTLDEDRPLEAAYKSRMEQRRKSKQITIPQDIDPSFPTSDPEDINDADDDIEETVVPAMNDDSARGRAAEQMQKSSPRHSPKRIMSPPPRRQGHSPPKRCRSPPPPVKFRTPNFGGRPKAEVADFSPHDLNISELVQRRPPIPRTKSLPRTPNPFFISLKESHQRLGLSPLGESLEMRDLHTRGPIDIVEGLEKKRQKRKEKFWRQHCRKAAKEQMGRRPAPGRGAKRMKELGLEVAERCRAYGVGQDVQLVLSV